MRLDRLVANSGWGSRADAARAVRSGRVSVDGIVVRDPARHVGTAGGAGGAGAAPVVAVDGAPLDHPAGVLVGLHKPVGYVCTHDGGEGPTIYDLLPAPWARRRPRPEAAGRLDRDTSGLIVVTDDHALLHRLTSPRHEISKTYVATLARPLSDALVAAFASGELRLRGEAQPCRPAMVTPLDDRRVEVVLSEGRYHQVRRMFAAGGNHVEALHRTRVGPWTLDGLAAGRWRDLTPGALPAPRLADCARPSERPGGADGEGDSGDLP